MAPHDLATFKRKQPRNNVGLDGLFSSIICKNTDKPNPKTLKEYSSICVVLMMSLVSISDTGDVGQI